MIWILEYNWIKLEVERFNGLRYTVRKGHRPVCSIAIPIGLVWVVVARIVQDKVVVQLNRIEEIVSAAYD